MYCTKCGQELMDGANFCTKCGAPATGSQPNANPMSDSQPGVSPAAGSQPQSDPYASSGSSAGNRTNPRSSSADHTPRFKSAGKGAALKDIDFQGKMKGAANTVFQSGSRDVFYYITLVVAVVECLLPFFRWMRIPMYNSFSNFLTGSDQLSAYSLFSAIGMMNYSGSAAIVALVLSAIAVIAIIFHIRFILKGLKAAKGYYKYGTIAAILMLVISILFLLFIGLLAAFAQVIKITIAPWLTLGGAIVNLILIRQLKTREQGR